MFIGVSTSQSRYMAQKAPNQIAKLRTQKGLSQAKLAEAVGAHWITISKLERGKIRLTQDWMNKIAAAIEVAPSELISAEPKIRDFSLSGFVTREDVGIYLRENNPAWTSPAVLHLDMGRSQGEREIWVQMATDNFLPIVHIGDLICFTYLSDWSQIDQLIDRLCLIHSQESAVPMVGILKWIGKDRLFNLEAPGRKPIRNVPALEIAGATMIVDHRRLS